MQTHCQVLIIGGGTAGIMTAAQLKRERNKLQIAIIEPSEAHWYQPAWTLVGAGTFSMGKTRHSEQSVIPKGVEWIRDRATAVLPEKSGLTSKTIRLLKKKSPAACHREHASPTTACLSCIGTGC